MAEIKWIKIVTDMFDDEKILLIETLPEGDSILVIWLKLLCLAGKQNNSGVFAMQNGLPYTDKMLSIIFRRKETTVQLALQTFQSFGMIEIIENTITIPNWGKHQNFDTIERKNEYMRGYMQDYRAKQKRLTGGNKAPQAGLPLNDWCDVLNTFNHQCAYCGSSNGELEQDHILPFNYGGKYEVKNIVPACRSCNASKGKKDMASWYSLQSFFSESRLGLIIQHNECKTNVSDLRKSNVSCADKIRLDKIRLEKDNIKTPAQKSQANLSDFFNDFWSAYPKKTGKKKVAAIYARIIKNNEVTHKELMNGVDSYKRSDTVKKGFIKNPETWLNGGCWADEIESQFNDDDEQWADEATIEMMEREAWERFPEGMKAQEEAANKAQEELRRERALLAEAKKKQEATK
jgi:predicted phage replisome organizer